VAGSRTGTPSIWRHALKITRLKGTLGASDLAAKTSVEFETCVNALVACALTILASDDFPLMIDSTEPLGPEDFGPA